MLFASFGGKKIRRSSLNNNTNRTAKKRTPSLEEMEGRQLLSNVPFMMVSSPKASEGAGVMNFNVTLTSPTDVPVTVNYNTLGNTATSGDDFTPTAGTLTFEPGEMAKTVSVPIVDDSIVEPNETFYLALSGTTNAFLINPKVVGTIIDNDAAVTPKLTIADVTMYRGLDGSKTMNFTVALNTAVTAPVSVIASTANINAIAGVDYAANAQVLTFSPGQTTATFSVTIYGSSTALSDEFFQVNLTNASVGLARTSAAGILKYGA